MTNDQYKAKYFKVKENRQLTSRTWALTLEGDTSDISAPGQFVNLELQGCFLRRPISVCDYAENYLYLLYDVVGKGTQKMSELIEGDTVHMLSGLGNGFNLEAETKAPVLIGGGIGVAPLLALAKQLRGRGLEPELILGFNTARDVVMTGELDREGFNYVISTADGSAGVKGFVTDALALSNGKYDYFYACGPMPMLKALTLNTEIPGELSLDERMACGFGVCMCCSLETRDGAKRICKDGPVFTKEELIWKN